MKREQPVLLRGGWLENKLYRFFWRAGVLWSPALGWCPREDQPPIAKAIGRIVERLKL